jgi:NAD(P)-dependent dehydrogenase (short-subunit alcohol dehydrogenase family)
MKNHEKRVVLVTGGSRGIGRALVHQFKEQHWQVASCATSEESLKGSPADLTFLCDVSNALQVKQGIQQVLKSLGRIDVVINNAGLAGSNPLNVESSDDFWHRIMDINLHGTYYMCKYSAPHLPDRSGRIINIASVLALKGVPDQTAYSAAKHGVLGFTRAFAHHLAPRKITVNAVCPGWVRTEMASGRMKELGLDEKDLERSVPLGRFIEPQEVADFVFYLTTSPGASMITGQALTIDGGTLA